MSMFTRLTLLHFQNDRERKYAELKNALDAYTETRRRGDDRFAAFAREEIAKIQNALVAEAQVMLQETSGMYLDRC